MTKFYYTLFNLIALTAAIYVGVDAFYRILGVRLQQSDTERVTVQSRTDSKRSEKPQLTDFQIIQDRNIFSKLQKTPQAAEPLKTEVLEPTSLKIKLIGTIAGDHEDAAAIIEETGKRTQALYRVGDSVQTAVMKAIMRGKVILRVGDRDEILIMEEPGSMEKGQNTPKAETPSGRQVIESVRAPIDLPARTITVRRSDIDSALTDVNNLLNQASIIPHFTDGAADGLAVTGIKAGSIFRKMGLRNGDIVKGVNGTDIQSPDDLISLYNDLKSASDVSLQITRRGQERTLNYQFRD